MSKSLYTVLVGSLILGLVSAAGIMNNTRLKASLFGDELIALVVGEVSAPLEGSERIGEWSFCDYEAPENADYAVELLEVETSENLVAGGTVTVDMHFKNTGNVRLLGKDARCEGKPTFNVGTQKQQDRESVFGQGRYEVSGWNSGGNRVKMTSLYAEPEEEFHVVFESRIPSEQENDIYREYFQPVIDNSGIEGLGWLNEPFALDIEIGEPTEQQRDDIQYALDLSLNASMLDGLERQLEVDLSEQTMYAQFGDIKAWSMPTSTGAWATPTPTGSYKIFQKQELRIGQAWPHYRMPYWQFWQSSGYGIHALPYLANDGGAFWSEAWDHIGIPVSHGCIRTLPADAETLYQFTTIGTPITIYR